MGQPDPDPKPAAPITNRPAPKYLKVILGCLLGAIGALFIVAIIIGISSDVPIEATGKAISVITTPSKPATPKVETPKPVPIEKKFKVDEEMAYIMAQSFVERRLKAPSTAVFPSQNDPGVTIITVNDTTFLISAYVDAQNTFGAMLRTTFYCMVVYVGNDVWQLESVKLEE